MDKSLTTTQAPLQQFQFTEDQVALIKATLAKDATTDELKLFLYQAQRTGLDPLARQIYFIKRQGKMTIQTSIDGFRVVAERSGDYSGQDEPKFEEKPGMNHPVSCTVTVYKIDRVGNRAPVTATAYWDEYKPSPPNDFMWNKMPRTMLSKVAEALALRKSFPQDLSGIYTDDEMAQARTIDSAPQSVPNTDELDFDPKAAELTPREMRLAKEESQEGEVTTDLASQEQRRLYFSLAQHAGLTSETAKEVAKAQFKLDSFTQITTPQLTQLISELDPPPVEPVQPSGSPATSKQKIQISQLMHKGVIPADYGSIQKLTEAEAQEIIGGV